METSRGGASLSTPIVFLHGFLGTSFAHFGYVLQGWQRGHQLVPLDLPGHGKCTDDGAENYFSHCLSYVRNIVERFAPVRLIGASYFGGTIAARLALQCPNVVDSLILSGFTYDVPESAFLSWANGFAALADRSPQLVEQYEKLHGSRWKNTLSLLRNDCNRSYRETALITLEMLKELRMRTALVNGDYKQNEREAASRIDRQAPTLSGFVIRGAGHIVSHDQPVAFREVAERFWAASEESSGPADACDSENAPLALQ